MDIEKYLAEICFCRKCGQGLRENFELIAYNETMWNIRCNRCNHTFMIYQEQLDKADA